MALSRCVGIALLVMALPGFAEASPADPVSVRTGLTDIQAFVRRCPTTDPIYPELRKDFELRLDGAIITTPVVCAEPLTELPIAGLNTGMILALQAFRLAYYMGIGTEGVLPWTTKGLYSWMTGNIDGVNLKTAPGQLYCCDYIDGKTFVSRSLFTGSGSIPVTGNLLGDLAFLAHEIRHVDPDDPRHTTGCPSWPNPTDPPGCDHRYNLQQLGGYGVQYWLFSKWASGYLNVGVGCAPAAVAAQLAAGYAGAANIYLNLFVADPPPEVTAQPPYGGPCFAALYADPFGSFDTPVDGVNGVSGSIGVTGWALDNVGVTRVRIMRGAAGTEPAGSQVYIGDASFVDGARPDVAAAYQSLKLNTRAGWGYLLLTNFLPSQGNGTFTLYAYAEDAEGHVTPLGAKTITCSNATATTPFGAIDTPGQGEVVSGLVNNFGWVLAPGSARADVPGGGTVNVFIDGAPVGVPGGWAGRSDLSMLFPTGFSSLSSTLAVLPIDTTLLANGVHTISWGVTATNGQGAGIGSRYLTVSNTGSMAGATRTLSTGLADTRDWRPAVRGRRGFALGSPWRTFSARRDGTIVIPMEELDRIELSLDAHEGFLKTPAALQPLPVGARLDSSSNTFTWAPGVAFIGPYDFVFAGPNGQRAVRIVVHPKGTRRVATQLVIDTPVAHAGVGGRFVVAGWAADLDDAEGPGIDLIHVWAYPVDGRPPVYVGAATMRIPRPDVGAVLGEAYTNSGFSLAVGGLAPGTYDVAVFPWSGAAGGFTAATAVRITVR